MNLISVTYSLISPQSIAQIVQATYALSENIGAKLIRAGDNDNYLIISGKEKFILRVYQREKYWLKQDSDYYFEMEWLNYLYQHQCPVSFPIQRRDGRYVGPIEAPEGIRQFALFSFAEGETGPMTLNRAFLLGQAIAKIHVTSNDFASSHKRLTLDLDFLVTEPCMLITKHLDKGFSSELKQLNFLAKQVVAQIKSLNLSGNAWGIIGGDFHGFNQHFAPNNNLTLFDFDLCGYGWRAYDLAVFRWLQVSDLDVAKTTLGAFLSGRLLLWRKFIAGYQSVRPLNSNEIAAIPLFVKIRQIWLMGSYVASPNPTMNIDEGWWRRNFKRLFKSFQ